MYWKQNNMQEAKSCKFTSSVYIFAGHTHRISVIKNKFQANERQAKRIQLKLAGFRTLHSGWLMFKTWQKSASDSEQNLSVCNLTELSFLLGRYSVTKVFSLQRVSEAQKIIFTLCFSLVVDLTLIQCVFVSLSRELMTDGEKTGPRRLRCDRSPNAFVISLTVVSTIMTLFPHQGQRGAPATPWCKSWTSAKLGE